MSTGRTIWAKHWETGRLSAQELAVDSGSSLKIRCSTVVTISVTNGTNFVKSPISWGKVSCTETRLSVCVALATHLGGLGGWHSSQVSDTQCRSVVCPLTSRCGGGGAYVLGRCCPHQRPPEFPDVLGDVGRGNLALCCEGWEERDGQLRAQWSVFPHR